MIKLGIVKTVKSHRAPVITERYILQNLRKNYDKVTEHILGDDYYNMACDVYTCDDFTCNDLIEAYDELKKNRNNWRNCALFLFGNLTILSISMIVMTFVIA